MQLVLFTGDGCQPCHDAEEAFRKRYKEEIASGEADIVNIDEDEQAQQFWAENELPVAPVMFVLSEGNKIITVLDPHELLEEAETATPAAVAQSQVEGL